MNQDSSMAEGDQFRCQPITRFPAGHGTELVRFEFTGVRCLLPSIIIQMLSACDVFATLDAHVERICRHPGVEDATIPLIRDMLRGGISHGFLVTKSAFSQQLCSRPTHSDEGELYGWCGGIATVGVVTHKRQSHLRRCLASIAEAARRYDRRITCVVADDSVDSTYDSACRQLLQDLHKRCGVESYYIGENEKRRHCQHLQRSLSCPGEVLEFALFGEAELGVTVGANRNSLLLHSAARPLISLDDDMLFRAAAIADSSSTVTALVGEHTPVDWWFFANVKDAMAFAKFADVDLMELHERYLGYSLTELLQKQGGPLELDFDRACSHQLLSLIRGTGRVRLTFNGLLGDSGTYATGCPIDVGEQTRARVNSSKATYEIAASTRTVLRGVRRASICHGGPFMFGCVGLDNRTLLPPFFPVLRNEDGVFGATLRACEPDAYFGHVPIATIHSPPPSPHPGIGIMDALLQHRLSELLVTGIRTLSSSTDYPLEVNLRKLGRQLVDVANLPGPEFANVLNTWALQRASSAYGFVRSQMERQGHDARYWREDAERAIGILEGSLIRCEEVRIADLASLKPGSAAQVAQRLLRLFGLLMQNWPDIVEVSKALRTRDNGIAVRIP